MAFGRPPTFQEYVAQRMAQALAPDAAAAIPLPTPNAALPFGPAGVPGNAQQLAEPGRQAANLPAPVGPVASPLELIAALQAAAAAAPQPGSGVAVVGNAPVGSSLPVRVRSTPGAGAPAFSPMVSIPNPQQGPPPAPSAATQVQQARRVEANAPQTAPPLEKQRLILTGQALQDAIRQAAQQSQTGDLTQQSSDATSVLQDKLVVRGMDPANAAQVAQRVIGDRAADGRVTTAADVTDPFADAVFANFGAQQNMADVATAVDAGQMGQDPVAGIINAGVDAIPDSVKEAVQAVPREAGHAILALLDATQIPLNQVFQRVGDTVHAAANGLFTLTPAMPNVQGGVTRGTSFTTPEQRQTINDLYTNGYTSPTGVYTPPGGRAVWEGTVAAMPDNWPLLLRALFHIGTDTALDPLSYLTTVAKAGEALEASARAAQAAGDVKKAAALNTAAQLLKAPDLLFNKSVEKGFDRSRELASRLNPFTPQTQIGAAIEDTSGARERLARARAEAEAAGEGGQPVPGNAGPMGGGGPTQPPLTPQQPGPTSGTAPTGGGGAPVAEPVFGTGPVVMTPEQRAAYRQAQQRATVGGQGTRLQQDELIGGRNAGPVTTLTPEQTGRVMQTPPVAEAGTAQAVITKEPPAPDVRPEPGNATATITVEEPSASNGASVPAVVSPAGPSTGQDFIKKARTLPDGRHAIYFGRTPDDTPVRIVQLSDGSYQVQYATALNPDGAVEWTVDGAAGVRVALGTLDPSNIDAVVSSVLTKVENLRQLAVQEGDFLKPALVGAVDADRDIAAGIQRRALESEPIIPGSMETTGTARLGKSRQLPATAANEPQPPSATAREAAQGVPTPEPDLTPAGSPEPTVNAAPPPARPQDVLPADRAKGSSFDKNREARRQAMEQLPPDVVSLPKQDLGYLDPSYVPVNPANPPPFGEVMAFRVAPQHPDTALKFWDEYTKLVEAHNKIDDALARSAAGPGGVREIRQTPRRVAERVKFQLDRAALVEKDFGESWVDGQEWARDLPVIDPERPSGYDETMHRHVFGADIDQPGGMNRFVSDVFSPHTLPNGRKETDALIKQRVRPLMRAMVEAAGIGPDDAEAAERGLVAARQARYFLRQADAEPLARQLLDGESPKRLAGELSDLRKTAYGEGALSQRKTSVAARERAKRQAVTVERVGKQQQWLVGTNLPAEQQGLLRKDADGFTLDLPGQESAPVPKEAAGNATKAKKWAQEQIANFLLDQRKPGFLPGSARRGMAATDLASSKANALIDRLQPRPIEASAEPAFVPERTEADRLFNRGGIDDETRDTLNMEIRTPVLAKTSRGDTYDKGLRERVNPKKETGPAAAPEVQQTLGGRQTGFTTVLDAIDTLVAAGVDDAQINTIVGRLVAEARGVNVARALKLPETGWERTLAKIKKGWGGWRAFIRENTQFGIHRIASGLVQDAIGDGWTAQAFGDWRTALEQFNPGLFKASVHDVRAGNLDALMRAGKLDYLNDLGETLPHDLIAFTEGRSESALSGPTIAGKATVHLGNRTIRPLSFLASEYARDARTAGDRLRRILAFDHVMRQEMRGASERFDVALVKRADAKGVDPAQWRQAITDQADAAGKGYLFSPEDIRRATGDEALARAWRSEIKQARKRGVAVVNKMYFTYKQTELDRILSQVTFFHYWMSRATVMHAEMALRHPRLIATYWRFWQGLQQEADRQGYPDTLKTYIRFMGDTKGGWYAYADPLSLIIPFTMFREFDREHAAWYERVGLYINPMVMGAAASIGMTDSIPDLLGTRGLENRIMPVWNLLQAHGVVGDGVPDQGVIQRITQAVVGLMNEGVRKVIPPARQFEPFSATGYIHDQLTTLIDARAEQLYGPRAQWGQDVQDQVHAAYASLDVDPRKNPLSAWAVDQWAAQSVKGAALSWFVPVRNRLAVRDAQTQAASAGYDALFDADPETQPTPEQQAAMDARQRARSTDPALVDLSQQYQGIGTPAQQTASKLWGAVAYAGNEDQIPTIEDLNGDRVLDFGQGSGPLPERITLDDLMAMDSKERMAVADRMVARRGLTADLLNYRHQRDAFKEANPAIGPFLDYQKVAYDYPGGVMAFANDLRRVSPNFNAYLTEQEARGPITVNDVTGVDAFIAQRGDQPDIYGPPPQDASNPNAVPGVQTLTGAGGGSSSASEDTTPKPKKKKEPKTPAEKDVDAINKDLDQIAEWQAAVNTVLSQGGNTIPYDQLEQFSRAAVDQELAANGVRKPSVGSTTRLYLLWRASQEPGADTSVEAFVRYLYDTKNQPNGGGA